MVRAKRRTLLLLILLAAALLFYFLSGFGRDAADGHGAERSWEADVVLPRQVPNKGSHDQHGVNAGRVEGDGERGDGDAGAGEGEPEFKIVQPFTFPQPSFSLPANLLLRSRWVVDLQDYLRATQGRTISMVTATAEHTDVLLNWLIAASVKIAEPLQNIIVISMDARLHSILVTRGIDSLYIHKDMIVSPDADVPRAFSQVHVVRLAVLRLMNHYGYDVINYDCDAIPLRNPQPIFDEYRDTDLIGTFGKGPDVLYKKWGVALNTGVMVMRANSKIGEWWWWWGGHYKYLMMCWGGGPGLLLPGLI